MTRFLFILIYKMLICFGSLVIICVTPDASTATLLLELFLKPFKEVAQIALCL